VAEPPHVILLILVINIMTVLSSRKNGPVRYDRRNIRLDTIFWLYHDGLYLDLSPAYQAKEAAMTWENPSFREINMNSEIGAYQEDFDKREVHGAKNNEVRGATKKDRHVGARARDGKRPVSSTVCGRRRVGEPALSSAQPRGAEAYLNTTARAEEPEPPW
jgi:hypothetical protein